MDVFGHRGAAGLVAENTIESVIEALKYHVDGIEIDVHCCKSGEVVVIHDETLNRTFNAKGRVSDYTLSELKKFNTTEGFKIPTLSEVLDCIDGRCILNIELKGKNTAQPVTKLLTTCTQNFDLKINRCIISSFDHDQLFEMKKLLPNIKIGVLTEENIDAVLKVAKKLNAYSIHPPIHSLTELDVLSAKNLNYKVFTWTVNTKFLIDQCKLWKVDGIITDFPNFAV